jgi:3-oxoacyl-[acyl-carrier protein] reductase
MSAASEHEGCALVTGASRGIGAAIACALAVDGWPIGVNFKNDANAAAGTVERIQGAGGRAFAVRADVTDAEQVEQLFGSVEGEFGKVLVLVNNAGVRSDDLAVSLGDSEWDEVINTNLTAAFRVTRRGLRTMIRERFGRVVNVASIIGPRANVGQSNYAAAKAGLIAMTKTVAIEVARRGVTVNAIAPGLIETDLTSDLDGKMLAAVPARRAGTPAEVAACACFLASEQAGYVTGSTLFVDGGLSV